MNVASATGDMGKANGGGGAAAAWVQGAAQLASQAAVAARGAGAAAQINSTSTTINGNVGTQININQGGDFQLFAGSKCSTDHAVGSDDHAIPNATTDGSMSLMNTGGGTAKTSAKARARDLDRKKKRIGQVCWCMVILASLTYVFSDQATTTDTHSPLLIPIPLKSPLQKQVAVHERSQAKRRHLEVCFLY